MAYHRAASNFKGVTAIKEAVTVGVDDTGHDVKFFGASAGKYMQWDEDVDELVVAGTMMLKEQADADTDVAAFGQLWVNTATPNELYFTDDAGTDFNISGDFATSSYEAVRASRSSSVSIHFDTMEVVAMDDEAFDTQNSYNTSTGRFTAQQEGKFYAGAQFQVNVTQVSDNISCAIKKNGANQDGCYAPQANAADTGHVAPNVETIFHLAVGDYLEAFAAHGMSGQTRDTYGDASLWATYFAVIRIM